MVNNIIAIVLASSLSVLIVVSISLAWFHAGRSYERKRLLGRQKNQKIIYQNDKICAILVADGSTEEGNKDDSDT